MLDTIPKEEEEARATIEEARNTIERLTRKYLVSFCQGCAARTVMKVSCLFQHKREASHPDNSCGVVTIEEEPYSSAWDVPTPVRTRCAGGAERLDKESKNTPCAEKEGGAERLDKESKSTLRAEQEGGAETLDKENKSISCVAVGKRKGKPDRVRTGARRDGATSSSSSTRQSHVVASSHTPCPVATVPSPTLGHSTPAAASGPSGPETSRLSLYGFDQLESPLLLSPVGSSPFPDLSPLKEVKGGATKPACSRQLLGTYDIPLKRPTPRHAALKRRATEHQVCAGLSPPALCL